MRRNIEDMPKCRECGAAIREPQRIVEVREYAGTRWFVGVNHYACPTCGWVHNSPFMERSYAADIEATLRPAEAVRR
jgi:hypothetical protein